MRWQSIAAFTPPRPPLTQNTRLEGRSSRAGTGGLGTCERRRSERSEEKKMAATAGANELLDREQERMGCVEE